MLNIHSYKGNESYVFISYAHRDSARVYPVIAQMQKDGYRVWFDEGIDPGTEWDENIAKHVIECGYFIAFISDNYLGSNNCKDELNYARDLSKKSVLVYLEDVKLTPGMAMRMNRIQSVFKYKYPNDNAFYEKFYESDGLSAFTSGQSQLATKPDAPTVGTYAPNKKTSDTLKTDFSNGNTRGSTKASTETIAPPPGARMEIFLLFGGVHVVIIENYDTVSDAKIIEDISYIGVRIPFYAFIREGEKELARHVLDKVGCSDFVI